MGQTKILSSLLLMTVWLSLLQKTQHQLIQLQGTDFKITSQKIKVHFDSNKGAGSVTKRNNNSTVTFFLSVYTHYHCRTVKIATVCYSSTTIINTTSTATTHP